VKLWHTCMTVAHGIALRACCALSSTCCVPQDRLAACTPDAPRRLGARGGAQERQQQDREERSPLHVALV
jgi:hypothetical protein